MSESASPALSWELKYSPRGVRVNGGDSISENASTRSLLATGKYILFSSSDKHYMDLLLKVKTDEWNILWNWVSRFTHTCGHSLAAIWELGAFMC